MRVRPPLVPCILQELKGKREKKKEHLKKKTAFLSVQLLDNFLLLFVFVLVERPDSSVMCTIPKAKLTARGFRFCVQNIQGILRLVQDFCHIQCMLLFAAFFFSSPPLCISFLMCPGFCGWGVRVSYGEKCLWVDWRLLQGLKTEM